MDFAALHLSPEEAPVALALAKASDDPDARSIAEMLEAGGVTPAPLTHLRTFPGCGVQARCGDRYARLGRPDWIELPATGGTAFVLGGHAPRLLILAQAA